jgi:hypothetical protein
MHVKPLVAGLVIYVLLFSSFTFPFVDAGKGARIVGSMKDDGRVLILVQNASSFELYSIMIESFSGDISEVVPVDGWYIDSRSAANDIVMKTNDKPLRSGDSIRFYIAMHGEESKLKFKWSGYDREGTEVAKGAFTTINRLVQKEQQKATETSTITETDIPAKYDGKYGMPRSSNGDKLTQFQYIWNKDPISVALVIHEREYKSQLHYNVTALIEDALTEWSDKLKFVSGNRDVWNFDLSVFYEGDEIESSDINIHVYPAGYLLEGVSNVNYGGFQYTPYLTDCYYNQTNEQLHLAHECDIYLGMKVGKYTESQSSSGFEGAETVSRNAFKTAAKQGIGLALGLNFSKEEPDNQEIIDVMSLFNTFSSLTKELYISQQDIDALLDIYGKDGFAGNNNPSTVLDQLCLHSEYVHGFLVKYYIEDKPITECYKESTLTECYKITSMNECIELLLSQLTLDLKDITVTPSMAKMKLTDVQTIHVKVSEGTAPSYNDKVECNISYGNKIVKEISYFYTDENGEGTFMIKGKDFRTTGTYKITCKVGFNEGNNTVEVVQ